MELIQGFALKNFPLRTGPTDQAIKISRIINFATELDQQTELFPVYLKNDRFGSGPLVCFKKFGDGDRFQSKKFRFKPKP